MSSDAPNGAALFTDVNARRNGGRDTRDAIDRFVEQRLRDESDEVMAPIIEPLLAEMNEAKNYEDLKARMAKAVPKMFFGKFQELLARAGFKINLAGNLGLRVTDPTNRAAQSRALSHSAHLKISRCKLIAERARAR